MEEEKAAAYYDELSRKGEGAARFKQGLGFSSTSASDEPFASKPKRPSSLFSAFVRASSPSATSPDEPRRKQAQLEVIQKKLRKEQSRRSSSPSLDRHRPRRSRSPSADQRPRRRSLSRSPDRNRRVRSSRDRGDHRSDERRRRSRSRERRRESDCPRRSRDQEEDYSYSRSRRRSRSPSRDSRAGDRERRGRREETGGGKHRSSKNESGGSGIDYSQLIKGYSQMKPAERVKAKMKLQLSETATTGSLQLVVPPAFGADKMPTLLRIKIRALDGKGLISTRMHHLMMTIMKLKWQMTMLHLSRILGKVSDFLLLRPNGKKKSKSLMITLCLEHQPHQFKKRNLLMTMLDQVLLKPTSTTTMTELFL